MRIKAIIIDDEPLAINVLKEYSSTLDYLEILSTFTNPLDAIKFLSNNKVDLIFIDIEMPLINGIDLVELLKSKPKMIFTTAYPKYAVEGFNLNALDYLLKPISYKRFLKAITKIPNTASFQEASITNSPIINRIDNKFIFLKSEYENLKINIQDIKYIEGLKDYLKINLSNDKYILTLSNFSSMIEKIANPNFIRVHNSYVINLNYIKSIQKNTVLIDDKRIPIGETYKKDFFVKIKLQ